MKCTYCGTTVEVPSGLWQPAEDARATGRWKTYIIVFLVVTVGIPTCASLVGTAAGIGASVLAAIAPFLLRVAGH